MKEFAYAHRDTSAVRSVNTFSQPPISEALRKIRRSAFERQIPIASDETLQFVICMAAAIKPARILELGTATGCTALALHETCPEAHITTVEKDESFYAEAVRNIKDLCAEGHISAIAGDAACVIGQIEGQFDLIFLDCAKAQYIKYLPRLKALLAEGGTLIADDVLLYGWASGQNEVPKKRKMLAAHIREYIDAVCNDAELLTSVVNVGDGAAVSVKR